nr:hypothetical protein [Tanacetum cinerariifolium]
MMVYLKKMAGFKMDFFKGMSYDDIRPIFEKHFNSIVGFLEKGEEQLEEEASKALKRKSESSEQQAAKTQKLDEKVEELKTHLQIVPNNEDDVYTEATYTSQYPHDLNMPELDDITYSDDEEDVGGEADFTNLETSIIVGPIPTTRVHKDHHINNDDFHTCMFACFLSQEEPKRVHQAFKDPSWIEAMQDELLQFKMQKVSVSVDFPHEKRAIDLCKAFEKLMKDKLQMSSMGELAFFLGLHVKQKNDGIFISQDKYVAKILRKFSLTDGKSASTPIDTEKPLLKDPDGEDVDVNTYRSMIGSLMMSWNEFSSSMASAVICLSTGTPLFEGMLVEQQIDESVADLNDDDVPAVDVADEGTASVNVVLTTVDEPTIPSPTPPTQPPPSSQDQPSTFQGRMIADMDADVDVTLKDIALDAEIKESADVQGRQSESQAQIYQIDLEHANKVLSMQDDEVEPAELQEVVEIVTTAKLITAVVTAASTIILLLFHNLLLLLL